MPSILSQVSAGRAAQQPGQRIIISGLEGVGKTTLACGAPGALLVPLEQGYGSIDVAKTPMLQTYDQVTELLVELRTQAMAGKIARGSSIVWDSASALERMIHETVLRTDPTYSGKNAKALTMESALGGYGKAYSYSNELFSRFTRACDELAIYGGINTILTCHVSAQRVIDPANGEYDSWELQLHSPKKPDKIGKRELATQWADMIGFMYEPMFVMKANEGEQVRKGISANQGRVIAVERTPSWIAKNRYGVGGTISIPREGGWNHLAKAVYDASGVDLYKR